MLVITQLHPIAVVFTLPEDQLQEVAQQHEGRGRLTVDAYSRDDQTEAGDRQAADHQQPDRPDDGHGAVEGDLRQSGQHPVAEPVRQRAPVAEDAATTPSPRRPAPCSAGRTAPSLTSLTPTTRCRCGHVQVALTQGNTVVIASGLQAGDRVVTDGQEKLQAGMQVAPQAPAQQKSGSSSGTYRIADMSISRPFILRPIATSLLMVGLLLVGIVAYRQLPISALPQVDYPTIQVVTFYPGRQSGRYRVLDHGSAGAPVRRTSRPQPDDLEQLVRSVGHHAAVQSGREHRRRRAGSAGGDQCGADLPAERSADAADL